MNLQRWVYFVERMHLTSESKTRQNCLADYYWLENSEITRNSLMISFKTDMV